MVPPWSLCICYSLHLVCSPLKRLPIQPAAKESQLKCGHPQEVFPDCGVTELISLALPCVMMAECWWYSILLHERGQIMEASGLAWATAGVLHFVPIWVGVPRGWACVFLHLRPAGTCHLQPLESQPCRSRSGRAIGIL